MVGKVHAQWNDYLAQNDREGIFVYLSDHGDATGDRNLYGKNTLYDNACKIPLIFEGDGIPSGQNIHQCTSILDIGPTLTELVGAAPLHNIEGESFAGLFATPAKSNPGRIVIAETIDMVDPKTQAVVYGVLFKQGDWKYINYLTSDAGEYLYHTPSDPDEETNRLGEQPAFVARCRAILAEQFDCDAVVAHYKLVNENIAHLAKFGELEMVTDDSEWWHCPKEFTTFPQIPQNK